MSKQQIILRFIILSLSLVSSRHSGAQPGTDVAAERLNIISRGMDSLLFVNRFESIETPCLYIDSADNSYASPGREIINSDYRKRLIAGKTDLTGVKCLSNYYSRYMKFTVEKIIYDSLIIRGSIQTTYSYPTSSLIQYLCITYQQPESDSLYFNKLIRSKGHFCMYPEKDKFVLSLVMEEKPFDKKDTLYGYLEISQGLFDPNHEPSYQLIFDHISLYKGDKYNQLSIRYASTTHRNEMIYFTNMVHEVLKNKDSQDKIKKAYATWLSNYLQNPSCIRCDNIYLPASSMLPDFILPNTQPTPPH